VKNKKGELGWISENSDAERSSMYGRLVKKHLCDVRDIHSAPNALIYSFRRRATVAHSNSDTVPVFTVVNTLIRITKCSVTLNSLFANVHYLAPSADLAYGSPSATAQERNSKQTLQCMYSACTAVQSVAVDPGAY